MRDRIKIFVGTDERMVRAEKALINSIRKNCSSPVEIYFMRTGTPPFDRWNVVPEKPYDDKEEWATRFSCFRFAIPELCGFKGKAIYLDVDTIVLKDLRMLWERISHLKAWQCVFGYHTCVSLIDCERFNWNWWIALDWMRNSKWGIGDYIAYLSKHDEIAMGMMPEWNCFDGEWYDPETTGIIHFTDMTTQPWKPWDDVLEYHDHPFPNVVKLWEEYENMGGDSIKLG